MTDDIEAIRSFTKARLSPPKCGFRADAKCPKCGAPNPIHTHGSTNLIPIPGMEYLCENCIFEW